MSDTPQTGKRPKRNPRVYRIKEGPSKIMQGIFKPLPVDKPIPASESVASPGPKAAAPTESWDDALVRPRARGYSQSHSEAQRRGRYRSDDYASLASADGWDAEPPRERQTSHSWDTVYDPATSSDWDEPAVTEDSRSKSKDKPARSTQDEPKSQSSRRRDAYNEPQIEPTKARKQKQKRKPSILFSIMLGLCIAAFIFSGYMFAKEAIPQVKAYFEYNNLSRDFSVGSNSSSDPTSSSNGSSQELPDFAALKEINSDYVGFLVLDGANIFHPVVQGSDNSYYLSHTFRKESNSSGCVFMDKNNNSDLMDQNTVVYGHKMKIGTMFAKLLNYQKQEALEGDPYFLFYTPDGTEYVYQIFASVVVDDHYDYRKPDYGSDFENFIATIRKKSQIKSTASVTKDDKIMALSTCTPSSIMTDGRFVLYGVLLNADGHKIDLASIKP